MGNARRAMVDVGRQPLPPTPRVLLLRLAALLVDQSAQLALDKWVEIAIHDSLDVACFNAGSMILDHLIRLKHVRANLISPGDITLLAVLPFQIRSFAILIYLVKLCFQHT